MIYAQVTGAEAIAAKLAGLGTAGPREVAGASYRLAEEIIADAKTLVPVRDGILRGSAHVGLPVIGAADVTVEAGFGGPAAPYAAAVHENPRAGKTGGISPSGRRYKRWATVGQWKYLEIPFKAKASQMTARIIAALDAAIARVAK